MGWCIDILNSREWENDDGSHYSSGKWEGIFGQMAECFFAVAGLAER